jgi:peptidoglycan LD-endopeptidase LytH
MTTTNIDTSWLWGVREAVLPVLGLVAVLWVASFELSVSTEWSSGWSGGSPANRVPTTDLHVPVVGTAADDLYDSFDDPRSGGRTHHAIDIAAPAGTAVVAAASGTVLRRGGGRLGGKSVTIVSPDSAFVYYYAHLSRYGARSVPGTRVDAGDRLGDVGTTGNADTAHLHFAIWAVEDPGDLDGRLSHHPVNPYPLLRPGS